MANNRMALVCKKCNLGVYLAKFYPQGGVISGGSSGWGQFTSDYEKVGKFFIKHSHDFDRSMWGGNQYEVRYEIDDNSWLYDEDLGDIKLEHFEFSKDAIEPAEPLI